jgi:uncharacterized membrane protein
MADGLETWRIVSDQAPTPTSAHHTVERRIALTDAVVAIAMTLLVLPLVEVAGDIDPDHLGDFFGDHWDLFVSFVVSFLVIYVFWAAHASSIRPLLGRDRQPTGLGALTMLWLLVIAFLPFPTAVVGRDLNTVTGPIYIGTMFLLSVLTSAIGTLAARSAHSPFRVGWAWLTTGLFAVSTVVSAINADAGMYSLLLLAVLRVIETRLPDRPPAS